MSDPRILGIGDTIGAIAASIKNGKYGYSARMSEPTSGTKAVPYDESAFTAYGQKINNKGGQSVFAATVTDDDSSKVAAEHAKRFCTSFANHSGIRDGDIEAVKVPDEDKSIFACRVTQFGE